MQAAEPPSDAANGIAQPGTARRTSAQHLRLIADNLPAMVAYWDNDQRCRFANKAYKEWFGVEPEELIGRHLIELLGEKLYKLDEPFILGALSGKPQQFEGTLQIPSGEIRHTQALYMPDMDGDKVLGFSVLVTDITKLKLVEKALEEANARLLTESITDQLTGLYNRRYFHQRSQEAFSRFKRYGQRYGLIIIDIDFFKQINDHFGHDAGDEVLRIIGELLARNVRADIEVPTRIGGEEFAILCHGEITTPTLAELAERLRQNIATRIVEVGSNPVNLINLSASFGVATCDERDTAWDSIYKRADNALYAAKNEGRDRVVAA
ncbi:MAG: diguanylate cyclase [Bacteroidota bacterium]